MINYQSPLDRMFHALADPTRRQFIDRLTQGPATVSELAAPTSMSMPAVFQHLKVLEGSGLIGTEKQGRVRTCRIEPHALQVLERWVADRRATWEMHFDRLGEVLDEIAQEESAQ